MILGCSSTSSSIGLCLDYASAVLKWDPSPPLVYSHVFCNILSKPISNKNFLIIIKLASEFSLHFCFYFVFACSLQHLPDYLWCYENSWVVVEKKMTWALKISMAGKIPCSPGGRFTFYEKVFSFRFPSKLKFWYTHITAR